MPGLVVVLWLLDCLWVLDCVALLRFACFAYLGVVCYLLGVGYVFLLKWRVSVGCVDYCCLLGFGCLCWMLSLLSGCFNYCGSYLCLFYAYLSLLMLLIDVG